MDTVEKVSDSKYMLFSCYLNSGQNHNISRADKSFENVAEFRYLGMTVSNKNIANEEIKSSLDWANDYYRS
jgi:hypothetical protein